MAAHVVGKPVVAVPECVVILLRRGEEAPDLRVLLEDVVHLHTCLERRLAGMVLVMSVSVCVVRHGG